MKATVLYLLLLSYVSIAMRPFPGAGGCHRYAGVLNNYVLISSKRVCYNNVVFFRGTIDVAGVKG